MLKNIVIDDLNYIKNKLNDENKNLSESTILITGCAGFLGFYFLNYLNFFFDELNIKRVIGLDNFLIRKPEWINKLKPNKSIEIINFNIVQDDISKLENAKNVDYIFHLASVASPSFYRRYPLETIDSNIWGLRKLLDFYNQKEIKGILFFSSSEIYGDPKKENIPTREEYNGNVSSTGPRACYDESKRFGETICEVFAEKFKMPIRIVRPFNNYGPGINLKDKRVVADFASSVISEKNIEIYSNGKPTRTFCYISDAIVGYFKAIFYEAFDIFNIGIQEPEISIFELAEIYKRIGFNAFNRNIDIILKPPPEKNYLTDNPLRRCPNIEKARSKLNYNPEINVDEGVERYLSYLIANGEVI